MSKTRVFKPKPCSVCEESFIPNSSRHSTCPDCKDEHYKKYNKNYNAQYHQDNRESHLQYAKAWKEENRDHVLEYRKLYHIKNRDVILEKAREWRRNNRNWVNNYKRQRGDKHRKHRHQILEEQEWLCDFCLAFLFKVDFEIDHIHPVSEKETYVGRDIDERENLRALCVPCHKERHRVGA